MREKRDRYVERERKRGREENRERDKVSISSMFYLQIFRMNVVSAAFSTYMLLENSCQKKLLKQHSYKKFVCKMLMKLTKGGGLGGVNVDGGRKFLDRRSIKFAE